MADDPQAQRIERAAQALMAEDNWATNWEFIPAKAKANYRRIAQAALDAAGPDPELVRENEKLLDLQCDVMGAEIRTRDRRVAELEAERDRLNREWPERNQIEGLGRALAILQDLRAVLRLTVIGRTQGHRPGNEPSYDDVLRHYLDAIEVMIGPDYTRAAHALTWSKDAALAPNSVEAGQ